MRNFEKKINELGFEVGKLSVNLNKEVAEFYEVQKELNDLKEELKDAKDEDVESIENEIKEGEEALIDFDEMIVESLEKYARNKPAYDEKLRKMAEGREKKKMAKNESNSTPQTQTQAQLEPIVGTSTSPLQPIIDTPPTPKVEEKKSGLLETLGWGALAIAGIFVGIRVFKNK
jgi:chromosome segregation ATPase